MSAGPSLYNPRDTQPEQLDALLTGRTALLDELLGNLREQADGMTRQHWLLRGQRGMGKTHLAGVIHYRVKTDGMLNKAYLPLWLGEADTYEVYSAATLLKTIGERLAEETKDADLLARLDKLEGVGDEEGYFLELAELLSAEADRRQRVLLVLMENLDALLGSFGPKERKEQTRQLRSLLLHNRHFLFVSTTPTYYLNNPLNDPKEPLYAHLKERDLDHLTESETAELLRKLVQLHPREGSENFLEGKDGRLRLRVIHRLTGGLPRSIVMAFTAIREAAGIGSLVQELRALLDAQTAYFEARLSQLPARERAIVTTMALAPTNLTMKEIAKRSRLPERTLSTLIHRLEKDGHVRPVARSGGKGTFYELSEGLFRLWYQYRKGRPVLEPLVDFLAYWYRAEELEHVVTALRQGAEARGSTRAAELALLQAEEALRRASSEEGQRERERFWAECQQALLEEKRTAVVEKWAGVTARQLLDAAAKLNVPDEADLGREQIHELLQQESLTNMDLLPDLLAELLTTLHEVSATPEQMQLLLPFIVEHFQHVNTPVVQSSVTLARLSLALLIMNEEPERAIQEADLVLLSTVPTHSNVKPFAQLARGVAMDAQGKHAEATAAIEAFLAALPKLDLVSVEGMTLKAWGTLVRIYTATQQTEPLIAISERIVARFGALQEEPFRFEVAWSRARLALFGSEAERIRNLEEWLALYGNSNEPLYRPVRTVVTLSLAILKASKGDSSASRLVDAWLDWISQEQVQEIPPFFQLALGLIVAFRPRLVAGWLKRLLEMPLSEADHLLLSWHLLAVEVLEAEDSKMAESAHPQGNTWARIPPELRQNVEELVKQVRTFRNLT